MIDSKSQREKISFQPHSLALHTLDACPIRSHALILLDKHGDLISMTANGLSLSITPSDFISLLPTFRSNENSTVHELLHPTDGTTFCLNVCVHEMRDDARDEVVYAYCLREVTSVHHMARMTHDATRVGFSSKPGLVMQLTQYGIIDEVILDARGNPSESHYLGTPIMRHVHPEDVAGLCGILGRVCRSYTCARFRVRWLVDTSDTHYEWVEGTAINVSPRGEPICMVRFADKIEQNRSWRISQMFELFAMPVVNIYRELTALVRMEVGTLSQYAGVLLAMVGDLFNWILHGGPTPKFLNLLGILDSYFLLSQSGVDYVRTLLEQFRLQLHDLVQRLSRAPRFIYMVDVTLRLSISLAGRGAYFCRLFPGLGLVGKTLDHFSTMNEEKLVRCPSVVML
ncbi:uncharacterized protein VTP21DRAFT_49 [Calcarisporiella thermophila]|uniref:uncharacterized protein n=1 Tax=Calcarisporiella thermophila TaxID=911321 RepID=UPI0037446DEB